MRSPLAKLQALLLITRSACSRPPSSVVLRFDLRLSHLLTNYEKTKVLSLAPSEKPLRELRSLLQSSLKPNYATMVKVDSQLEIRHGKFSVESDMELADIVAKTAAIGVNPTLRIIPKDPTALPAPPAHDNQVVPLPSDIGPLRLVSFFKFTRLDAELRSTLRSELLPLLNSLHVRGSIYLAAEGINGQLSVPLKSLDKLRDAMCQLPGLSELKLNAQHAALGTVAEDAPPPYRKLVVREKAQILTDGLSQGQYQEGGVGRDESPGALDWDHAGTELDPSDWHAMLEQRVAVTESSASPSSPSSPSAQGPILLDCRNDYESEAGTFEGAVPLNTEVFSQSWDVLREKLADVPRDQPIMTFCTGGIRCVKTNAYLEQELGFTNTYRLKDGIHGYLRHAKDNLPQEASKWQGENFVFYEKNRADEDNESEADDEH